jgi:EmrB/QacA subfamily drug resistance transporter
MRATRVEPAGDEHVAGPANRSLGLAVLCFVLFLTFLDTTVVSVALASVQQDLHAGVSPLQWVVNGYALVFASLMLLAGSLGDRFGRKRVMLGGLAVFCAGSLLAALAPNVDVLIAARAVMGAGAAASEPGTLSMIRHLYPEPDGRARALGKWAAVSGLALALGPVIGGALVGVSSWRAIFWFNLGAGLLVVLGAALVLPESADPVAGAALDLRGFALGTLALGALVFGIIVGEGAGYGDPVIVALFAVALLGAVGFVRVERRARAPMLELGYFRRPAFSGALVVAFTIYFGVFSVFFFTTLYLQSVIGYSAYKTAEEFLAMAAAMIIASLVAGRAVAAIGPRIPMAGGCLLAGGGLLWADAVLQAKSPAFGPLALALALAGVGFGLTVVPVTSIPLSEVRPEKSGMAASATNTCRELGAVIGVAVLGALVNGSLTSDLAARLHSLHIPNVFQVIVIKAIETGGVPQHTNAAATYGAIVNRVISAAYGAFRSGIDLALVTSAVLVLAAGGVAVGTLGHGRDATPAEKGSRTSPEVG